MQIIIPGPYLPSMTISDGLFLSISIAFIWNKDCGEPLYFGLLALMWRNLLAMHNFTAQHVNNLDLLTVYRPAARDTVWQMQLLITAIKEIT